METRTTRTEVKHQAAKVLALAELLAEDSIMASEESLDASAEELESAVNHLRSLTRRFREGI